MHDREIPLVFAGGEWGQSRYGRWCQQLGKRRGNTFFIEKIAHELMPLLYSHAAVHVLPSLRESPGLASLEAALYGASCIVSIHCPVTEYFGDDALVCDPADIGDVRDKIIGAWNAPLSDALRLRVLNSFTWARAAQCTHRAYERILRGKRSAPHANPRTENKMNDLVGIP
jgi:glycosyltransferase involved in cell wall biosynthesis